MLNDWSMQSLMELTVVQEVAKRQSCCRKSACVSISQTNPDNEKNKKTKQNWSNCDVQYVVVCTCACICVGGGVGGSVG